MSLNYTKLELGMGRVANILKPLDLEFQPFIEEINAKEEVIQKCADAATIERIRSTYYSIYIQMVLGKILRMRTGIEGVLQDITSELNG